MIMRRTLLALLVLASATAPAVADDAKDKADDAAEAANDNKKKASADDADDQPGDRTTSM